MSYDKSLYREEKHLLAMIPNIISNCFEQWHRTKECKFSVTSYVSVRYSCVELSLKLWFYSEHRNSNESKVSWYFVFTFNWLS